MTSASRLARAVAACDRALQPREFGDQLVGVGNSQRESRRHLRGVKDPSDAGVVFRNDGEQLALGERLIHVRGDFVRRRAELPQVRQGKPVGL